MMESEGTATKKPIEIEYFIWNQNDFDLDQWVQTFGQKYLDHFVGVGKGEDTTEIDLYVKTKEGSSYIVPTGYFIIRGVEGEYYPCDPVIFEKTYDY